MYFHDEVSEAMAAKGIDHVQLDDRVYVIIGGSRIDRPVLLAEAMDQFGALCDIKYVFEVQYPKQRSYGPAKRHVRDHHAPKHHKPASMKAMKAKQKGWR